MNFIEFAGKLSPSYAREALFSTSAFPTEGALPYFYFAKQLVTVAHLERYGRSRFCDAIVAGDSANITPEIRRVGKLLWLKRPIVAVPAANPIHCFAAALYGPHASGADIDPYERAMLARIAGDAAAVYAELEINQLRSRIRGWRGKSRRLPRAAR